MNGNVLLGGAVIMAASALSNKSWPPELAVAMVLLWMGLAVITKNKDISHEASAIKKNKGF